MASAEETSPSPVEWAGRDEAVPVPPAPRRRLFRKYALIFIALVGAALLINSGFDFWFSYQENKAALVRVQQEKAESAAQRIAEFVEEIKSQIGWTTHAQWAAGPLDQRRQDYVRLLRQVPAITELSQLDGEGKEQLKVSRLAMDVVGSEADFSQSPAFTEAKARRVWFSPVYFRKESEPYMTLAMARDGRNAGVTVAEINLKLIWDVITALKIGQGGYAYVVDGRGRLIAHPDISLVLRDTDLSKLPQVAAALAVNSLFPTASSSPPQRAGEGQGGGLRGPSGPTAEAPVVTVADNLAGHAVLTAHAVIPQLGWRVFVEVPRSEAFAPLYGAAIRTLALLALGLVAATLVALAIARRMIGPIRAIAEGAERIGAGELGRRIDVHTGDELEALAQQFNRMAGDLQKSYAELEQRVRDRTAELSEALEQQTATADVLRVLGRSPGSLAPVFNAMLARTVRLCDASFGIAWTYESGRFTGAASEGLPPSLREMVHGAAEPANVGGFGAIVAGESFVATENMAETEVEAGGSGSLRQAIVEIGGARSEIVIPIRPEGVDPVFGEPHIPLGALTLYRREVRPFTDAQIALLRNFATQALVAIDNTRLITETREALEQQTATAEVLGVINSSPGDLAPVFDAMLEKAMRLCNAAFGNLLTYDGERFQPVAHRGLPAAFAEYLPRMAQPGTTGMQARLLAGAPFVHVADLKEEEAYRSGAELRRALVDLGGARTGMAVPLRRDDKLLGSFTIYRQEVRPFSDKEIALLQNFAAQAVIAMENARLITETREALEQQTATAEVLGVINSSPGDLAPVFDAILNKAHDLCGAELGVLLTFDGERFWPAAAHGGSVRFIEQVRQGFSPGPENPFNRILHGERFVQIPDLAELAAQGIADPELRIADELGIRTFLIVPLRKDDRLLGAITANRREVRPFSDKQIALLQNFAAQAVIAMENARLITETREALEQQTATAEVLGVINASPGDLTPVFDAILEKATDLCEAAFGVLWTREEELFRAAALRGVPPDYAEFVTREPRGSRPGGALQQLVDGAPLVHIPETDLARADPTARILAELGRIKTLLAVPLRKDGNLLGGFTIYRQEVRPFSEKQIALLQNFAAQAVIAMENARLITETREALEQQTATAEVLGVINASPGDLAPVFDAMLEKATSLCGAAFGELITYDGERFETAATRGVPAAFAEFRRREHAIPEPGSLGARVLAGELLIHVVDLKDDEVYRSGYANRRALVDLGGARTALVASLRKDERLLGFIILYRQEVRPFSDKQIALLQNFAAQAVIAMENARLITETREALDQQTATAEVLGVINSSPGDLAPVFDAILEKAHSLCGADFGGLLIDDGERLRPAAQHNMPPRFTELIAAGFRPVSNSNFHRLRRGEAFAHVPDFAEAAAQTNDPIGRAAVEIAGIRTQLLVPLRKDEKLLGVITANRREVRPFSDKQIALLQNFAAQAVIAMENARLLDELRGRTRDLQESLEYQTATSDVLRVISGSVFDLEPVLQTVVSTAIRLCRADQAVIYRNIGGEYQWAAGDSLAPEYERIEREIRIRPGAGTLVGRAALEARTVHILDARTDPLYEAKDDARVGGVHTMLGVPLLRDGTPIGVIGLARQRVEPFSDKEIALVTTFADQAVIAIENARLLTELRERTDELARSVEELKALAEVGQAVSSTLDLDDILSTILNRSVGLTGADAGVIFRYSQSRHAFRFVEAVGWDAALIKQVRAMRIDEKMTLMGEAVLHRAPAQIADLRERPGNVLRDANLAAGYRSVLIVPLVGADRIFGALLLQRRRPGEFPEATLRLMQTLAAQSVLAIQNARLFREIADKSEQLALASQHKSQFLANMSHELRTPLNAILGYAELLVDGIYGDVPEKAMGVLERVQNNGKHLLALINDVLDLSKIEAGQLVLTFEDYALPDVVQSVVTATEALASTKGLRMTATVQPGLPTGHGDARRLSQVLLNLVGNAVKFTDQGEVAIGAMAENGQFVLTVRDTGPGIAPEDHGKIFEEFQQVDSSNTRKKGGTGLGLAISKRMVEMQGGSIEVESQLGHGATFRVTLPVRVENVADELAGELAAK